MTLLLHLEFALFTLAIILFFGTCLFLGSMRRSLDQPRRIAKHFPSTNLTREAEKRKPELSLV